MKFGITNREVIQTVKHSLQENGPREIFFLLLRYRSAVISQKMNDRKYKLSKHNFQTLGCIPLDDVPSAECPCAPEGDFTFKKTRYPIPKSLGDYVVFSIGNNQVYDFKQWDFLQDLKESFFKGERNSIYYTMKTSKDGTYLYLYNDKHGENVAVTGIFENPLEVQNFPDCDGKVDECFSPLEQEFIIDPELLPLVTDAVINSKLKYKNVSDIQANDIDDAQNHKPPVK
jgi:hypothetical protein